MAFNSLQYAAFMAVVVLVLWKIPGRTRNGFLLVVSYAFYASWDWRFMALILTSTAIGYYSGLALESTDDVARRKRIVMSRVALNLALLGVFKYFNFFVDSALDLARAVGVDASPSSLRIILPIAISYMTFEEISYAVDIYRGEIRATRNPVDYALFVAFFPKLVAGPILRPKELLPQISSDRPVPDQDMVREGFLLIMLGLFKKVVLADTMARIAQDTFSEPGNFGMVGLLVGVYAFAFQIYGDFSGYSDIARGSAQLLGFRLPVNFRQPYLSNSVTAFWQTWHISLSSWLRDYLYIPLGGNRRGARRTMINLFLVMLLGGLWHGAAWTFVIWGALHGVYLAVERLTGYGQRHNNADRFRWADLPRMVVTFHLVCISWILFRAPTASAALDYVKEFANDLSPLKQSAGIVFLIPVALAFLAIDLWQRTSGDEVPWRSRASVHGLLVGTSIAAIVAFSGASVVPFIYFQF